MTRCIVIVAAMTCANCSPKEAPKPPTAVERLAQRMNDQTEKDAQASLDRMDDMDNAKAVVIAALDASKTRSYWLPGPSGFKDFVRPYLKISEQSALDHFVWTFPGGSVTDLESISDMPIGHVGKAIAYADGHVSVKE